MSNEFAVSDWHLGDPRMEIMARPFKSVEEMVETMILRHNSIVNKDDLVYCLGDVCYKETPEYLDRVSDFNGTKILIRGNHDREISDSRFREYFEEIIPEGSGLEKVLGDISCYLTHYPSKGRVGLFNIVGHIHSAWKYQLNMMNAGVDVHHYYPVNLASIPSHFKAITEFYDDDVWVAYADINGAYRGIRGKRGCYFEIAR